LSTKACVLAKASNKKKILQHMMNERMLLTAARC